MKPLAKAFGKIYGSIDEPAFITDLGVPVWMWRKGNAVRFYTSTGEQIACEQRNVGPAVCFALANGWSDVISPAWNVIVTGRHIDNSVEVQSLCFSL